MNREIDVEAVSAAFWSSFAFVYHNALAVAIVSLAWVVASLPLLTVGPATLGAYAAVASLRERGTVDAGAVLRTVRRHALDSLLLGGVVALLGTTSLLYVGEFVRTETTAAIALGIAALYVTVHLVIVLIPTFVALAGDVGLADAVKTSYRWSVTRPAAALAMLTVTAGLLIASLVLTVAFPLVYPALVARFHTELLGPLFEPEPEPVTPGEARPRSAEYPRANGE